MTFTIAPKNAWAIGYFDSEERAVYFADGVNFFLTPQAVLDHVRSDHGEKLKLGPTGLVFVHIRRTSRKSENHYFQSLTAANRFHQSLSR